jgi:hypothetical protein
MFAEGRDPMGRREQAQLEALRQRAEVGATLFTIARGG